MSTETAKKVAAEKAVSLVENGMVVGLGTGSTVYYAIKRLAELVNAGLTIQGVPTSDETEQLALGSGIPLISSFVSIDLTIDGADEVDAKGNLIKGGGGALTREKIVAAASKREIIIVDETKIVYSLGAFPLPVEVLKFGLGASISRIEALGCRTKLREKEGSLFETDNGNYIVDCQFTTISNPQELSCELAMIPGVLETGLFVGLADTLIIGYFDGRVEIRDCPSAQS